MVTLFLGLDDTGPGDTHSARRLSAWTTRVAASLRYPARKPRSVSVEWGLFNNAVLSAHALVVAGGQCAEHRFSTYNPSYAWSR